MITPKDKDIVLAAIASEDYSLIQVDYDEIFPSKDISKNEFRMIINQFEKLGLIKNVSAIIGGGLFSLTPTADLHDMIRHGGFTAQEELLRANLEKLGYELEKLAKEPGLSSRVAEITGIAASITTALGLFR